MKSLRHVITLILLMPFTACTDVPASDQDPSSEGTDSAALEDPGADVVTNAATGGCSDHSPISACISRQGNSVLGDFYMKVSPDSSFFSYTVAITRSHLYTVRDDAGRLDH